MKKTLATTVLLQHKRYHTYTKTIDIYESKALKVLRSCPFLWRGWWA